MTFVNSDARLDHGWAPAFPRPLRPPFGKGPLLPDYEFIFVVDGITLDDHAAVNALTDELDAVLSCSHGVHRMTVSGSGPDAVTAAGSVVARARALVPGMRILRLDPDLVGVSDIAERTGRSRQNVTQWIHGQRRDGVPFPAPEGTVGRSLVWLWSDVNAWLRGIGLDDGEDRPTRDEATEINWLLRHGVPPVHVNVDVDFDVLPGREDTQRIAALLVEHARMTPRFIEYLLRHPQVRDARGRSTVVVCSPEHLAADVFARLRAYGRPVVVATITTGVFAQVISASRRPGSTPVELPPGATVRDWIGLIALYPDREFSVGSDDLGAIGESDPLEFASR